MIIDKTTPVDLTGLTRRDILDIEREMQKQRERLTAENLDTKTLDCMMDAIYRALIICKKENKKKYTPKKFRKE